MTTNKSKPTVSEGLDIKDLVPGADGKLVDITREVEKFLEESVERAAELADELEEMRVIIGKNQPDVAERNRILLFLAGKMRAFRNATAQLAVSIRQQAG